MEIPRGVEYIGEFCFFDSGVEEITLPSTLKEIGRHAFANCNKLKVVWIEDGCAVNIGNYVNNSVTVLSLKQKMVEHEFLLNLRTKKDIVIPISVEIIEDSWFWGCEIESVSIPTSVREIKANAFRNCRNLKYVTFAENGKLEKIEAESFYNAGIEKIFIPKTVTEIRENAFRQCESLKEVLFEERNSLKKNVRNCFYSNETKTMAISKSIEKTSQNTFEEFTNLAEIIFEKDNNLRVGIGVFRDCSALAKINLPEGLKNIEDYAFMGSGNLKNI